MILGRTHNQGHVSYFVFVFVFVFVYVFVFVFVQRLSNTIKWVIGTLRKAQSMARFIFRGRQATKGFLWRLIWKSLFKEWGVGNELTHLWLISSVFLQNKILNSNPDLWRKMTLTNQFLQLIALELTSHWICLRVTWYFSRPNTKSKIVFYYKVGVAFFKKKNPSEITNFHHSSPFAKYFLSNSRQFQCTCLIFNCLVSRSYLWKVCN